MTISEELQKSYDLYKKTHENPNFFHGYSIRDHLPEILGLISCSTIKTYLDYGCGKGLFYRDFDIRRATNGLRKISLFDPGVPAFSTPPQEKHDMTVCIDVMEHVPEHCVDEVLDHIASLTTKIAFFSISVRPASKKLVDGTNAHATVRPRDWWLPKLERLPFLVKAHFTV